MADFVNNPQNENDVGDIALVLAAKPPPYGQNHVKQKIMATYNRALSSNSAKPVQIELPEDLLGPTQQFKPRPPLHAVGTRQTSARRPKPHYKDKPPDATKCFTHVFDGNSLLSKHVEDFEPIPKVQSKNKTRRIQSAKSRLTSENTDELNRIVKESKKKRPISAINIRSVSRPTSATYLRSCSSDQDLLREDTKDIKKNAEIEPCVFGYKSGTFLSGSGATENNAMNKNGKEKPNIKSVPYKKFHVFDNDNLSISDLIDFDEDFEDTENPIPQTLRPLLPWRTPDVSQDLIGVDPKLCLVFLPSLLNKMEELPCVPPPQSADEDLHHYGQITAPTLTNKNTKLKKYDNPWERMKIPIEDPTNCKHHQPKKYGINIGLESSDKPVTPRQIKVYRNGSIVHESFEGERTEKVIRKEIQELEDLMKGIGTDNGFSVMVQYQADINRLQNMVDRTLGRVEEIEKREAAKLKLLEPTDHFGLRKFYRDHDELIVQIEAQHKECLEELSNLTSDLQMDSARQHFEKQLSLKEDLSKEVSKK